LIFLVLIYFIIDVGQWREDQATNYWLGLNFGISNIPTGLISSKSIPNPNGMIILGKLMSYVPGFKQSIIFYSILQLFMLTYFISSLKIKKNRYTYFLYPALIFNTYFVFSSTELWSQFFSISLNLFIFGILINSIENNREIDIFQILNMTLLLSSFYLGGFLSSACFVIVLAYLAIKQKLKINFLKFNLFSFLNLCLFLFLIFLVWIPFFKSIDFSLLIISTEEPSIRTNLIDIFETIFYNNYYDPFLIHSDYEIFSVLLLRIRTLVRLLNFLISLVFSFSFLLVIFINLFSNKKINISYRPKILLIFTVNYYVLSPLLGGPNFFINERIDMELPFYFTFLIGSLLFVSETIDQLMFKKYLLKVFSMCIFIFSITNLIYSTFLYKEYINYDDYLISGSDVPLKYKLDVVEYLYNDSSSNSLIKDGVIKVFYDLSGNNFEWIDQFGEKYPDYYLSPYTIGRIMDLLLIKEHNIKNSQEGLQIRTVENVNYIVTYRFNSKIELDAFDIKKAVDINRFRIYRLND